MTGYVRLSTANLTRLYEWAEANPGHPLGRAYMAACYAMGEFCDDAIHRSLPGGGDIAGNLRGWRRAYARMDDAYLLGLQYRDAVGRLILSLEEFQSVRKLPKKLAPAESRKVVA